MRWWKRFEVEMEVVLKKCFPAHLVDHLQGLYGPGVAGGRRVGLLPQGVQGVGGQVHLGPPAHRQAVVGGERTGLPRPFWDTWERMWRRLRRRRRRR